MAQNSIERKDRIHASFIVALDRLDAANREPDRWEEECLSYALGGLACGMYLVAEVELAAFSRPACERSADVVAALEARPRRFSKAMLRHGLDYVLQRYDCVGSADDGSAGIDMAPALAAGQFDFQPSSADPGR